ncbi:MAG: lysine--tRNA ligase [Planctomycetota bacterium]
MSSAKPESENADQTDPRVARREKLQAIRERGIDPFGQRFDDRDWVGDCRKRIGEIRFTKADGNSIELPDVESDDVDYRQWKSDNGPGEETGPTVRVSGRIQLMRPTGKLIFLNIRDWTGEIQIFVGKKQVGDDDFELAKLFDLGDLVGAEGRLGRTNTGELTVFAQRLFFHTKMLEPPPDKHAGLKDMNLRSRMRYADLAFNDGVVDTFLDRTRVVKAVRQTLDADGFAEIEGPTLHTVAGGAAARPFNTHHNALDMPLTMRIALELHLKRLMVGGMERVYELGRVYRNEGIDATHNPEFTMMECYQAYGNYESMMDLTERVIAASVEATGGSYQRTWNDQSVDLKPPFRRAKYLDLIADATGIDARDDQAVITLAGELGLAPEGKHPDVVRNDLFEDKVEATLSGPVFVIDYPASICPLTKRKADDPTIAERFELFVCGMELANAYTELNDPDLQEELFRTQLKGQDEEDSMAKMDHDFIRALRHAMPPAGGLGIGIDRLVMLMTGKKSIRDVILFPLMRPE